MKILLAVDSFKGSMSSIEVIQYIEETAKRHFSDLEIIKVPIADGGEGTVDSLVIAAGGECRYVEVTGPLKDKRVKAKYGVIDNKTAVIELAQASGLTLLSINERNPMLTTTYGTGEVIKAALDEGIREFIIGIGGSATNDGGIGAAQALGVRFLDKNGNSVGLGGQYLSTIDTIVMDDLDPRIAESSITVICDVTNPLTGPEGATAIYGPQKGANSQMLEALEAGMKNYAEVIRKLTGVDIDKIPGAGAAGGIGAAMVGFFGVSLKPGIDTILDFINFDLMIENVDLVITGEGKIDGQSVFGKVPVGVSKRCRQKNIPVVALAGIMGEGARQVYNYGINSIMTTVNRDMTVQEAMARAEELLKDAADRMFRLIKTGMQLQAKVIGRSQI
jgi:glycerate kinase